MTRHHGLVRGTLLFAAVAASAAHIPVVAPHLVEAPYMGLLFIAFIGVCLGIATVVAFAPNRTAYRSAAVVCGAAVATYAATRLVAFPQLSDDVGHWFEPLGVVSVLTESVVVACAVWLLRATPTTAAAR
jgi:hypothetical protein